MATNFDFTDKVVIVTGGGSGIGQAAALKFGQAGAHVVVSDINQANALTVANEIAANDGKGFAVKTDVGNGESVQQLINTTMQQFGRIDVMVANAGIALAKPLEETSEAEFDRVLDVNLKGIFWCAKYTLPIMTQQGGGAFVVTASKVGLVAQLDSPIYCASKGGAVLLTKAMALDYAPYNIRVNCVCPGIVETPLLEDFFQQLPDPAKTRAEFSKAQPLGRLATAAECADAILYLASDAASFITGVALPVDGGFTAQ